MKKLLKNMILLMMAFLVWLYAIVDGQDATPIAHKIEITFGNTVS